MRRLFCTRPWHIGRALAGSGLAAVALAGCYTVEFDETKPDVFYCQADSDCASNQSCQQFRCVDDTGPQVRITLPEPVTPFPGSDTSLVVDYDISDFTISDSNEVVEGQGKVRISIDEDEFVTVAVSGDGIAIDISAGLSPGAHRLWVQAVYGDGVTPYTNPGASDFAVFFTVEQTMAGQDSERPQLAITSPSAHHVHVVGEPLEVTVAVRNFAIVDNGNDCRIEDNCDPWNEATPECIPACPLVPVGHAHIYIEPDYPTCLSDTPIGCNGDYILSMRPSESQDASDSEVTAIIPGNRFDAAGTYTFSASLQYNDHDPYPNAEFVVFDQFTLTVVE